jgi:hypothetical protein
MSWKDCADSIRRAAGRDLTDEQVAELFEVVERRKAALEAEGRVDGLTERVREAVAADADRLRIEAALAKKHAALSVIARDRVTRMAERHLANGLSYRKAVLAIMEGTTRGVEGGRNSISATKLAYEARYVSAMMGRLIREVPHAEGLLRDRAFLDDVVREMFELREGGQPGRTGNRDAMKTAKVFADGAEQSRRDLNRLGANVGKLDGWAGAQVHDADKIAMAGREAWIDRILPRLDLARTFEGATDEASVRASLGRIWENIVFQREKATGRDPGEFRGPRNVANALERQRVLHFASPDAWLSYQQEFGEGHIFDGMVAHQSRAAMNAAQMEILGPNPGATLDRLLDTLRRRVDNDPKVPPEKKAAVKADLTREQGSIGRAFRIASGAAQIAHSQTAADIGGTIRAVQSLSKLGGALISSISDLATTITNLRFNGLSFGDAVTSQFRELMQGRGAGEQRQLAYLIGEGADGIIGHIASPFVANDSAPGQMHRAMTTFFRWTGLTWWTDANRAGAARILSANLGRSAGTAWDGLNPRLRNVLSQHDIGAAEWDVLRQGVERIGDRTYLTPDAVAALPDEAFAAFGRGGRERVELALRRYFADEAQFNVIEADAATQRFTTMGTQRGTIEGEAIRFMMQFKAFPIAFTQRTLGRAWQGGEGGASAGAAHIGTLIVGMTALGYLAMTAKDAIRGYTPREVVDEDGDVRLKTMLAALAQGGGAGIYGDFLFGETSRSGNRPLENLAGPVIADTFKLIALFQKARDGEARSVEALNAALASTPFANVWYVRPVLDYLIINAAREALAPGSLSRADQRRREDYGQDALIPPSDRMAFDMF